MQVIDKKMHVIDQKQSKFSTIKMQLIDQKMQVIDKNKASYRPKKQVIEQITLTINKTLKSSTYKMQVINHNNATHRKK